MFMFYFFFLDFYFEVIFFIGNKIIKIKKGFFYYGLCDLLYNEFFNFFVFGDDLGFGILLVLIMYLRGGGKEDYLVGRVFFGGMMYVRGIECEYWIEMMMNL